ncbi:hypothetical protein GN958_ATG12027 [Phytophthora infestans]|uniref:Uncharacterized protein n=1 Tax=Phytophthora infestans TaxID=4787 RepID=A0A8S9UK29_PHYIN|nr:hypothetical protein GN958_ATG12027 [Phytophthora infestans]
MASPRKGKKTRQEAENAGRAIAFVRAHRNKAFTKEEILDILVLQANLRTCGEIGSSFLSHGTVFTAAQPANRGDRISRLPNSLAMQEEDTNNSEERMHLLAEESYLSVDISNTDSINTAIRTVQRLLKKENYSRGAQKGKADKEAELLLDTVEIFKGETTPKQGSRRAKMISATSDYKLEIPTNATKAIVWNILSKHIKDNVAPVIVDKAREKGEVGRQYSTKTTFADIKLRLQRAFENISPVSVQGCIDAANRQLTKLKKHLEAMDSCNESSCDSENESD